jgi:hypothetical protein
MEARTRFGLGQAAYPCGVQGEFMLGAEIVQWVAARAQWHSRSSDLSKRGALRYQGITRA